MKLENEILIPTETEWGGDWIDYKKSVYLIRADEEGNTGNFQFDGTSCAQGSIKGLIHAQFQTKGKYFNEDWWYKKTSWGEDYPTKVYFDTAKIAEEWSDSIYGPELTDDEWVKLQKVLRKKQDEAAAVYGRPAEKMLANIIKTAEKKTGIDIDIDFPDGNTDYGVNWHEAYVPVKFGKKLEHSGILTWMNCD